MGGTYRHFPVWLYDNSYHWYYIRNAAHAQSTRNDLGGVLLPSHTLAVAEPYPFDPLTYPFLTGWLVVLLSCRLSSPPVLLCTLPSRFS
jgi:hypothetical protein